MSEWLGANPHLLPSSVQFLIDSIQVSHTRHACCIAIAALSWSCAKHFAPFLDTFIEVGYPWGGG